MIDWTAAGILLSILGTACWLSSRFTKLEIAVTDHSQHCDRDRAEQIRLINENSKKLSEHEVVIAEIRAAIE